MHTIETAKEQLLETLENMDKSRMSFNDLMMYAQILKIVSEIQTTNYNDVMAQALGSLTHAISVSDSTAGANDIKEAEEDGM